ncbi:Uncharacterized protein dnm_028850 [Desulfonema magnum]|uniref:Uncharacterized protein n=1 Tax=Desulfonema magnum TaxID=45655 RepID=A0A975BKN6_9BACT|nr:Uncharacterized protein dnm_028850 [Desulfonema magnum]
MIVFLLGVFSDCAGLFGFKGITPFIFSLLVPTLCVGMHSRTLRVPLPNLKYSDQKHSEFFKKDVYTRCSSFFLLTEFIGNFEAGILYSNQ